MPERDALPLDDAKVTEDGFEPTLGDALIAFAEQGVRPVDAVEFTGRVAGRSEARHPWLGLTMPRLAWALLLVALLAALLASFIYIGARPRDDPISTLWSAVVFPEAEGVSDVVPMPGGGYLAVGSADHTPDGLNAAAWTSADCVHWQRVEHQPAFQGGAMQCFSSNGGTRCGNGLHAESVVRLGDRTLAVGWGAFWLSNDGRRWERVTPDFLRGDADAASESSADSAPSAGDMDLHRLAVLGDRFVVVGGTQGSFGLWSSRDGRSWQPSELDAPPAPTTVLRGWAVDEPVRAITETGTEVLVAGPMGGRAAIWSSSDGLDWRQVLGGEQAVGLVLTDLAAAPDGTAVAIGRGPSRDGRWPPTVWRSDDGKTWSQADLDAFASSPPDTDATLDRIVWADRAFVVFGTEPTSPGTGEDGETRILAWSSADGVNWRRETPDPAFESASLTGVMRCGDRLMVTGWSDAALGVAAWARTADSFGGPSGTQVPGPPQPSTPASVP